MSNTVRFTVVLASVCLLVGGGVGGIFLLTRQPIAVKAEETECAVRRQVLPAAKVFREVAEGSRVYSGHETDGGPVVGYVAVGEAGGYGGKLQVMTGLDTELALVAAAVLAHSETPGLGADCAAVKSRDTLWTVLFTDKRSERTCWMDQFAGKRKGQLVLGAGIDTKTGCTITSKAIVKAARAAIEKVEKALRK